MAEFISFRLKVGNQPEGQLSGLQRSPKAIFERTHSISLPGHLGNSLINSQVKPLRDQWHLEPIPSLSLGNADHAWGIHNISRPAHTCYRCCAARCLNVQQKRWNLGDHQNPCLPHYQYHFSTGTVLRFMFDILLLIHSNVTPPCSQLFKWASSFITI